MRRVIAAVGRVLVTFGLLVLLFVAYQLWGTGVFTARAQTSLRAEFEQLQRDAATTTTLPDAVSQSAPVSSTSTTISVPQPAAGDPVGVLEIPDIGLDKIIVEGVSRDDLRKGPGHYPGTPLPGQIGNVAIAGHRTTYGAPFFDLDQLEVGDEIIATTVAGRYVYTVSEKLIVQPSDVWVVDPTSDAQMTLTTCNPKYSAQERLVIKATLVVQQSSLPTRAPPVAAPRAAEPRRIEVLEEGLSGEQQSLGPAFGWGIAAAIVGLAWWMFFRRNRHPLTWFAGLLPFLTVLLLFFVFLERLLPAGY